MEVDGVSSRLWNTLFPTIDPASPYELTEEERHCVERIRRSFMASQKLWEHVRWMVSHGEMYLRREEHLIFHGCVPVDKNGEFLPMMVNGQSYSGRALFDAIDSYVYRLFDGPLNEEPDLLCYLWSAPESPILCQDWLLTLD